MNYVYEQHYCDNCGVIQVCIITEDNKVECLNCDKELETKPKWK
ncbi:hypothetical protein SG586P1_00025 [Streptococcus phage SG586P1]|nr:hypothetical protein SG586P1_00025 [Streptococcus phage SG586P1]WAX18018.1 hypothetical protein SG586P3_00013 [Streptococcus phage SG586P3]